MAIRAWAVSLGPEKHNEVLRGLVSKHQGLALIAARLDQVWKYGRTQGRSSVSLPGESQGQGSLVGCRLWGRTESDMTEAT